MALERSRPETRSGGASALRVGWRDRLDAALRHHRLSARDAFVRWRAAPLSTLLTVLVLALALSLPAALLVALDNLRGLAGQVEGQAQVSLFLTADTDEKAQRALARRLRERSDVAAVDVITREQALAEFRAQSGYGEALEFIDGNPLPGVLVVRPVSVAVAAGLQAELARERGVEFAQLDSAWLQKLDAMLAIGSRLAHALAVAFLLVVLLVMVNTIRLAVENRRDEILVSRLVGATDAFVRRPFLYTGLWAGLAGGLVALVLVAGLVSWVAIPVDRLAALYGSTWTLQGPGPALALLLPGLGALLGVAGAWLAVSRHLRQGESL